MISLDLYFPYYQNLTINYLSTSVEQLRASPKLIFKQQIKIFYQQADQSLLMSLDKNNSNQLQPIMLIKRIYGSQVKPELIIHDIISILGENMGKLKTKYPVQVSIQFFLFLQNNELLRDTYGVRLDNGSLLYSHVYEQFLYFLQSNQITYEAYMFFQSINSEQEELMRTQWALNIQDIEQRGRYIMVRIKSHTQYVKELIYEQINHTNQRIGAIQDSIKDLKKQKPDPLPGPSLNLSKEQSNNQKKPLPDKDLDIGILFSEPIYDEKRHQEANFPVDFRSQLQRLYSSLENSYKPQITVQCEIGTKQHLKHLIGYKKPKILHIICHGSKHGELQFQDDSNYSLGALCTIDTIKLKQILLSEKQSIPQLVFVNSCYSQLIGRIFFDLGAKYVIMIDSQDKIDDEAAQIFSENFYRNIFRGEKVQFSFKEAKDTVGMKHNSFGCCCRHTAQQKHKNGCRWLSISQQIGLQQAHKLYHIPSEKCLCQLRNLNRHKLTCQWARFCLFHINKDFRIKGQNGEEYFPKKVSELPAYLPNQKKQLIICCCFNFQGQSNQQKIPHSQCNKFKMLAIQQINPQPLYQLQRNVYFRTQIIDYSAPQLIEYHQKVQNICVMGRQQELYEFMNKIKDPKTNNIFIIYGHPGVGKTSFSVKTATYLIQRRIYSIYFFIDLYNIKDKDMFLNKFNQVTKFGYPNNKANINEVRGKRMIIILDNADEFFKESIFDFVSELEKLRKQLFRTKFIITCKQRNFSDLQNTEIITNGSFVKELKVLDQNVAARALFSKIRNYLDISIQYMDIRGLISLKKQLQIPKVIENLSQSFSSMRTKVKLSDLKIKIDSIGVGDIAFNRLVQENLNNLKKKYIQSYQILIFISQFSQGIDKNDFNILSMYDRNDLSRDGRNRSDSFIDIPIDKNWKTHLAVLFDTHRQNLLQQNTLQVDGLAIYEQHLQRHATAVQINQNPAILINQRQKQQQNANFKGQSYFLQQISKNRFIVKRFIRDFIWNQDQSSQNYYMKYIFVVYTAVMLDIYLEYLVTQKYYHEQLLQYSDISNTGIFKYKDNNYVQCNLSLSIRYQRDYISRFERILRQSPSLRSRIQESDPSIFILNHKLDFLHIYGYDWTKVYQYLQQNRPRQAVILITYLQKLVILIPTALKIANAQDSLIQYSIRQSIQLLSQIKSYSRPQKNLLLTLKLKLIKINSQILRTQYNILNNTQIQRDFNTNDLNDIQEQIRQAIRAQFNFQLRFLEIYKEYLNIKELKKSAQISTRIQPDRLIQILTKLQIHKNQDDQWEWNQQCQILNAKRKLVLAMTYFKVLEISVMSTRLLGNLNIIKYKMALNPTFVSYAESAAKLFLSEQYKLVKLGLRAKLIGVAIGWQVGKHRARQNQFNRQLQEQRQKLKQCLAIFQNKQNNLIGLTFFDIYIKKIAKQMKEKMWQQSVNNFIFMKAVPLSSKQSSLLENAVRNKQKYRKNLQKIFTDAKIDICMKFEILTIEKLQEQTNRRCTILLLNTNIKIEGNKIFLVLQGSDKTQEFVQINDKFIQKYPINNASIFFLIGQNAYQGIKKLAALIQNPNSMIAITSSQSQQFEQFAELDFDKLRQNETNQLKKIIGRTITIAKSSISLAQKLIQGLIRNHQGGIIQIFQQIKSSLREQLGQIKVDIIVSKPNSVQIVPGIYKDVSPGYRKAHNIDYNFQRNRQLVYRKWKEINQVFKHLSSNKTQPKYIRICGNYGSGKSTFLQQIGRMFIERGMFENGVYIIHGKDVEQKYQGDFEAFIIKNSEVGRMFTLPSLNKYAGPNFMLMIDDFHLVKPRSNGRYKIFLNRLIDKKVNLMLVTHQSFNINDIFTSIRTVKIQKMNQLELDIYAYNVLDLNNQAAIQAYQAERNNKRFSIQDIFKIRQRYTQTNNVRLNVLPQEQNLRRMSSNRN